MRGRDPETGEFLDESRSAKRREALDVLAMAGKLMDTGHAALALLPMPEELRALVVDSQRIRSNIARKRQTQWLAKQMRREDDAVLVQCVAGDPNAIGYFGFGYVNANRNRLRPLTVVGPKGPVAPSVATV